MSILNRRIAATLAIVAAAAGLSACSGQGMQQVAAVASDSPSATSATSSSPAPTTTSTATPSPTATLGVSDVELTTKVIKKSCFGSAGCNVQYRIVAAVKESALESGAAYEVTYNVLGLEDEQTGTLTMKPDGTYSQDDYQSGSIRSSKTKLTAKVTDVQKSL